MKKLELTQEFSYKEIQKLLNEDNKYSRYRLPTVQELKNMYLIKKLDYMSGESSYPNMVDYVGFNIIGTDKMLVREHRIINYNYPLSVILVKK
jgi:hypothetical protein